MKITILTCVGFVLAYTLAFTGAYLAGSHPVSAGQDEMQWRMREACIRHGNVKTAIPVSQSAGYTSYIIVVCNDGVDIKLENYD